MIRVHSKDSGTSGSTELAVNTRSITKFTLIDDKDKNLQYVILTKYVNLPRDEKFIKASNGLIKGAHQLSNDIWCKIQFHKPGYYTFDLSLKCDNPTVYTQEEKDHNKQFTSMKVVQIKGHTDEDGVILVKGTDIFVSQSGGNTYTLYAECNGETKRQCRSKILTKRMLFYADIKMKNSDGSGYLSSIKNDLSNLVAEYKSHHIELVKSFDASVEYMPNIDTEMQDTFLENVTKAYSENPNNKQLDPYCLAITYVGHLAVRDDIDLFVHDIPVGPGKGPVAIDIIDEDMNYESLWHKINHPDDPSKNEWYIECSYVMVQENVPVMMSTPLISIPKEKFTLSSVHDNPDNCSIVHVDVSHLPAGYADISLTVNIVRTMRAGLTFSGTNIVCLCTKGWWKESPADIQDISVIHEVGHAIGMVPSGSDDSLDKGVYYYLDRGHLGPHCHSGVTPIGWSDFKPTDHELANCVMYGRLSATRNKFCEGCSTQIKKLDLAKGVTL